MNKKPKQVERIISYLNAHGEITALDALRDLGIMRLASRMHEIRKSGVAIEKSTRAVPTRYEGVTANIAVYRYAL